MTKAAFVYGQDLTRRDSRADEVFGPTRLQYTYELLKSYGAFDLPDSIVVAPGDADEASLLSFHTPEYLKAVKSLSDGENRFSPARFNFSEFGDNPVYPGMYELATLVVGASLRAAEAVLSGEADVVFNCAGGQHHAAPDHASGFCIFNDPVIAINRLLAEGLRVAYVDVDAHHGDGVLSAYYHTDRVLAVSLHESGRYLFPGTGWVHDIGAGLGRGYTVNLPLEPWTDGETYLWLFDQVVPPLVRAFSPDALVTQLGVDTHFNDPLAHLLLTSHGFAALVERLRSLAEPAGRWLALGGGGYDASATCRCWTLAYGVMCGQAWPEEIPEAFRGQLGLTRLHDVERPAVPGGAGERAREAAAAVAREARAVLFPLHGLAP